MTVRTIHMTSGMELKEVKGFSPMSLVLMILGFASFLPLLVVPAVVNENLPMYALILGALGWLVMSVFYMNSGHKGALAFLPKTAIVATSMVLMATFPVGAILALIFGVLAIPMDGIIANPFFIYIVSHFIAAITGGLSDSL